MENAAPGYGILLFYQRINSSLLKINLFSCETLDEKVNQTRQIQSTQQSKQTENASSVCVCVCVCANHSKENRKTIVLYHSYQQCKLHNA